MTVWLRVGIPDDGDHPLRVRDTLGSTLAAAGWDDFSVAVMPHEPEVEVVPESTSRAHVNAETVRGWLDYRSEQEVYDALSELEQMAADAERFREALERVYQLGRGPHVGIARNALGGAAE